MKKLILLPFIILAISCNCKKDVVYVQKTGDFFEVLKEESYQGKEQKSYDVIKNEASLKALYQSINDENIPKIDFSKQRVVALFLGQRNSGGFAIKVKEVSEKNNKTYITVDETKPEGMATMAITNPYTIVKINSTNEIIFK